MLRATVYVINPQGIPRNRLVRDVEQMSVNGWQKPDEKEFQQVVLVHMLDNGEVLPGESVEFGPIGAPWRRL